MCITEEEFREQRKAAMETLAQLKEMERHTPMKKERMDAKTWVCKKKNTEETRVNKKKYRHVLPSERALEEFFIDSLFDEDTDEIVYVF